MAAVLEALALESVRLPSGRCSILGFGQEQRRVDEEADRAMEDAKGAQEEIPCRLGFTSGPSRRVTINQ